MALAILAIAAVSSAASAQDGTPRQPRFVAVDIPPPPPGPVLDEADIFPVAEEAALNARLRATQAQTGVTLVVVTVNSLQGAEIGDFAFTLFNGWGIGRAASHRGLLVLLAPNERVARIEVGCGLISVFSDQSTADIMQQRMLPKFREGNLPGGINAVVDALTATLESKPSSLEPGPVAEHCGGPETAR